MWPFTRKADTASPVAPTPAMPQIHFDWKHLPPIQRSVAELPLTIPTEPFAAELATHQDPRATAQPLGHNVSLEAPAGIVLGMARPQTRSDGPELVPASRPRRRPVAQRVADVPLLGELETPDVDGFAVEEPPPPPSAPLRRLEVSTGPLPSVQLTSVTPDNGPQPLRPLQEVAIAAEQQPAEAAETEESAEEATEVPFYPRLTLGQARRLGLGAPIPRVPDTATNVQRSSDASLSPTTPSPPSESTAEAEEVPQFQPFPLDILVNKWPEVVAPAPISRPQRIASPLTVARSVSPERPGDATSSVEPIDAALSQPEATASASPPEPVQRFAESPQGDGVTSDQAVPPSEAGPVAELARPPAIVAATDPKRTMLADTAIGEAEESPTAPLPALPLATELGVKKSLASDERGPDVPAKPFDPHARDDSSTAEDHVDVALATSPEARTIAPLVSERPHLGTAVQRTTDSAPSPARTATEGGGGHDPMPGRALLIHELVHVDEPLRQDAGRTLAERPDAGWAGMEIKALKERSVEANLPLPLARSAFSPAPTSPRDQSAPSVQASSALETWPSVQMSAARETRPSVRASSVLETSPSVQTSSLLETRPSVQTSTAVLESAIDDGADATIQRAPLQEWTVSAAADLSSTMGTAGPHAAAETPAPGGDDEARMEDLAGKLYDRIRIRLRNELLVDRERAGFLTDLR
ncbi:MAG TPA: hypothetical protein VN973_06710 [Candidatus Dormibacteraeota bacterium]|nr:hypothetical protein [Candidatus Dormibacteraeota bacterium]